MKKASLLVLILAVLFTIVFYKQIIGLNLVIFEILLFLTLFFQNRIRITTLTSMVILGGILLTAVFVVLHASAFVITMNLISLFISCGLLLFPGGRSIISFMALSFENIIVAPANVIRQVIASRDSGSKSFRRMRNISYFIIPAFLVLFFLMIYQQSNPFFSRGINIVMDHISKWLSLFSEQINSATLGVFLLGLLVSGFFLFRKSSNKVELWDRSSSDILSRPERKKGIKTHMNTGLRTEFKVAIILLITLNLLIAIQNILDIRWIWFGFEWNGQYLKQFVHRGTYLLIISILTSIVIILWFFRGNLNFYPRTTMLKTLSYTWLAQNMLLTISVGFRVYWYIQYFGLAYLRIGVILFLILTFIGLITVMLKVSGKNTFFYLVRNNTLMCYMVLTIASFVNWDIVIASYNFDHYRTSFVHLDFLSTLSDKSLPALDRSPEFLATVRQCQDKRFSFETEYMSTFTYQRIIQSRKKAFLQEMDHRGFLSWNLADARAAARLRERAK